jgi:hypothetical protein
LKDGGWAKIGQHSWAKIRWHCHLVDHLSGAFDQSGQDVEGATAEPHWLVALEQEPLCCN